MDQAASINRDRPIDVLGLGMAGVLDPVGTQRVASADVLAGGARLLERFAHLPGERIVVAHPLEAALDSLAEARERGRRVAVLADGDPLFFGIGARLVERFGREALRFTPGVTAVQASCARLGLAWHDLPAVSLHGREDPGPLLAALAAQTARCGDGGRVAVYTDAVNTPDALARLLISRGLEEARLWVLEDMDTPSEQVRHLGVGLAASLTFSPLNLVIVEPGCLPGALPMLGRSDDSYEKQAGLITKWPARACALAALRLGPQSLLWDVGAGSGALSVEACALIRSGRIFAVERDGDRCRMIRENIRRFRAVLAEAVPGEAPGVFANLPDPDRIFLGGSLGGGPGVLAEACRRLKPGGRLVANTVLLGSLGRALEYLAALGWPVETAQIQAGVSVPLNGDERLAAHNPVFIIAADKPA
jgi:precorrin-6Y C5,15-methyltransferase (decarboxylating)